MIKILLTEKINSFEDLYKLLLTCPERSMTFDVKVSTGSIGKDFSNDDEDDDEDDQSDTDADVEKKK